MNKTFNWSNFDLEFLNSILNSEKTPISKRPKFKAEEAFELSPLMETITPYPNRQFVIDYRREIESNFLKKNQALVISVFGKSDTDNPHRLLWEASEKVMGEMLANRYIVALNRIGYDDAEWEMFYTTPIQVDLSKSALIEPELFGFQTEAVEKLQQFSNSSTHRSGFLVMPTGSGKTRTAVTFLLEDMISQGYQVIWLAHRHLLINQAADEFKNRCPLVLKNDPSRKEFRILCASGKHGTIKAASKTQDVMILSVQTAVRNLNFLTKALKKKVIIVVDEAHHTVAPSYRRIVNEIRKKTPDALLLGLTATPVRFNDYSTAELYRLFEGNFIYTKGMSELIKNGVLSEPHFSRIETGMDFEPQITTEEGKYIDRFGNLPESVVNKIALSKQRNALILKQYFKHNYGKTLIFAMNIIHSRLLTDELQKLNVKCDCVYSGQENNEEIIRSFKEGKIDVLVNINILTEGSDVPGIETVFLTRPTQSESLLMQMIGRGMRGKLAGGTDKVEIVDFVDKWDVFNRWLDPEFVLVDATPPTKENNPQTPSEQINIPWSTIRAIYREMGSKDGHLLESQTIPLGWYSLNDEGQPYTLLVFQNQIGGYRNLISQRKELIAGPDLTSKELLHRFFNGMGSKPTAHGINVFWDNLRNEEHMPHLFPFQNRREVDPYSVAQKLEETGEELFKVTSEIYQKHEEMVNELFGSLEDYRERVFKIRNYRAQPDTLKIEELPIELVPFILDNPYDLVKLYTEVKEEMQDHLIGCLEGIGSVVWTDKPYRSFFGRFYGATGNIEMNCILNSSNVPREAVKYVLFHELLHSKYWCHDKTFRSIEHLYPNYTEWEKFLDADFGNFRFEY